ncbi:chitooligosaccharide deacetylase [Longimycelium tulufanense]|uniref:Chitooligosaccharide deacetylase n=1 Tax=Longimycelium tulufanense TaxID=907463 RepID=A0A8J3C6B0_9PSEU|nr:polysaccharide deacetylase family protein [Longimycelium tulufanense]GGM39017.1 chitooligosaccharide deacetylase [Longimycelium tulufanense]
MRRLTRCLPGFLAVLVLLAGGGTAVRGESGPDPDEVTTVSAGAPPSHSGQPDPFQAYPVGRKQAEAPPKQDGKVGLVTRIKTDKPVMFVTVDDGIVRDPKMIDLIRDSKVRPALFLTEQYVRQDPKFFRKLREVGATIENHTLTHPDLAGMTYGDQRREICETADKYRPLYGERPQLLRPPYGSYDDTTLRVAADCGMKAAVNWTALVEDGQLRFQGIADQLYPGDIVLMHFTENFEQDLKAVLDQAKQDGLTPASLRDFLG